MWKAVAAAAGGVVSSVGDYLSARETTKQVRTHAEIEQERLKFEREGRQHALEVMDLRTDQQAQMMAGVFGLSAILGTVLLAHTLIKE